MKKKITNFELLLLWTENENALCFMSFSGNTHFPWSLEGVLSWCFNDSTVAMALSALGDAGAFPTLLATLSCCSSGRKLASFPAASDWLGKHVALKPGLCLASQTHGETIALLSVKTESSCLSPVAQTARAPCAPDSAGCSGSPAQLWLPLPLPGPGWNRDYCCLSN